MRLFIGLLLAAFALSGCDSRDNQFECMSLDEIHTADCLAEAALVSCGNFHCTSANSVLNAHPPNCTADGCETIECDEVFYTIDQMSFTAPGTITDFQFDETSGLIGIINVEGEDQVVECVLFQQ